MDFQAQQQSRGHKDVEGDGADLKDCDIEQVGSQLIVERGKMCQVFWEFDVGLWALEKKKSIYKYPIYGTFKTL